MFKNIFVFTFISILFYGCKKEIKVLYKKAEFQQGLPEILKPIEKSLPFEIQSYSLLESNNDSIDIYIGFLKQGQQSGNWIALASNNQIKQFTTVDFKQNSSTEKENDIDIEFNNSTNRVSLRIKELDTLNNKISYSWIKQSHLSDSLTIQRIDRPLIKGKIFPKIELTDINGVKFDLDNFKEEIVVINWWAVWCAPCRKEIPDLKKLVNKYFDKKVKFISITDDSVDKVSRYLEKNEFKYDITFVSNDSKIIFGNTYPKNIVIDVDKTITFYKEGGSDSAWQEIDQHLTELNNKKYY